MEQRLRISSRVAASAAGVIAILALAGWALGIPALRQAVPLWPQMVVNTAVGLLAAGLGLAVCGIDPEGRWRRCGLLACGAVVTVLGGLTLAEYVLRADFGIDTLLHPQTPWEEGGPRGRMAPATALGLVLIGLLLLGAGRRCAAAAGVLAGGVMVLGLTTLVGLTYGARELPLVAGARSMSVGTASALCLLAGAVVAGRPGRGAASLLASPSMAGVLTRRLIPAAILVPVVLGLLHLIGEERGWHEQRLGIALLVVALVVGGVLLVVLTARRLEAMERSREGALEASAAAERALRESESRFRSLFESMDEGFCIIEVEFDEGGRSVDYRFLETNPAFERQTGLRDARGRSMRGIVPGHEEHWFEIYGRIALTGEPVRFEEEAAQLGRWYDVYAWRYGDAERRQVAVLFNDVTARKRVERAVRDSESFYRQTLESIPGMVFTNTPDGACDYVSSPWVEFTGIPAAEQLGDGWTRVLHEEDRGRAFAAWRSAVEQRGGYDLEYRVRRHDGEYEWFKVRGRAIRGADGRVVRWFGTAVNINDLKLAEAALHAERSFLRRVIDATPSMVFVKDWDGRFVLANEALAAVYGTTVDGVVGRTDADFNDSAEEVAAFLRDDREVMVTRREKVIPEEPVTGADGALRWFSTVKVPLVEADGTCRGVLGVATDITEQQRAKEAARESEQFARRVLDGVLSFVAVLETDGTLVQVNRSALEVSGVRLEEVRGRKFWECPWWTISEEVSGRVREACERAAAGEVVRHDTSVRVRETGRLEIDFQITPLRDGEGRITHLIPSAVDITERKRAESALATYNERLAREVEEQAGALRESLERLRRSERMAFIGTLSAGLGHDIGNLLLPLRARLDSVRDECRHSEQASADVAAIRDGLDYLGRLTRGLRALASESEPSSAARDGADLSAWWEETRPLLRAVLPPSAVLEGGAPPAGVRARIGVAALTQIVFNLVQNAADALRGAASAGPTLNGHGRVRVGMEPDTAAGVVRITVEDNGPGMSPEVLERCTEPFYTTKTRGRATGMGLSLVQGLAAQAGGRLDVRSEVGRGSAFTVTLPVATPARHEAGPRPLAMVTFEDKRMAAFIGSTLAGLGFEVAQGSGPNGHCPCLWVVESGRAGRAELEAFMRPDCGRRVVVVGGAEEETQNGQAGVLRVPGRLDAPRLKRALHEAAQVCGTGTTAAAE